MGKWSQKPCLLQGEKKTLPEKKFSSGEDQTHDAASIRTTSSTRYQLSYSGPVNGDACTDLQIYMQVRGRLSCSARRLSRHCCPQQLTDVAATVSAPSSPSPSRWLRCSAHGREPVSTPVLTPPSLKGRGPFPGTRDKRGILIGRCGRVGWVSRWLVALWKLLF